MSPRVRWALAWTRARGRAAKLFRDRIWSSMFRPATWATLDDQADAALAARAFGIGAWPRLDAQLWRAWVYTGRPCGSWAAFKGDHSARAGAMLRLAAAVRRGELQPGGRRT